MSSAAKLRKFGRGTATIATAALVMTSFGPAAFAWDAVPSGAAAGAGQASIGLIDADDTKADTQGATVVAPGDTNAAIGDVRFVIPSTFKKGDSLTFVLGDGGNISSTLSGTPTQAEIDANIINQRVSFASKPAVAIDSTAYAANTHIQSTSPVANTTAALAGSVEAGKEAKYSGAGTPVAPQFTVDLASTGTNQFNNMVRVTFTNDSDPNVTGAKFIGAINGAKINVGSLVASNKDLGLTATAYDNQSTPVTDTDVTWWGDTSGDVTTYPATISTARLDVTNGSVVADGTAQYVGPVTIASAAVMAGAVTFSVDGGTFDQNAPVTATAYDADGKVVGTPTAGNVSFVDSDTISHTAAGANIRKVVFTGMAVKTTSSTLKYTLDAYGGTAPISGFLGANNANNIAQIFASAARNQSDIQRATSAVETQATSTVVATRLGGKDRYETAVKIAEQDRGTTVGKIRGEADNVIIASGETFPDALSAGYLAATKDAPVLLTRKGFLPQTDIEFLKNYGAKNVYIVGGEGAVSKSVEKQLRELQSYDVQAIPSQAKSETTVTTYGANLSDATLVDNGTPTTSTTVVPSVKTIADKPAAYTQGPVTATVTRTATDATVGVLTGTAAVDWAATVTATGDAAGTLTLTHDDGTVVTVALPIATSNAATQTVTINVTATTKTDTTPGEIQTVSDKDAVTTSTSSNRRVVPLNANLTVMRLAGENRFATNRVVNEYAGATSNNPVGVMVPEYGKPGKKTALVANGLTPWDSLAAGPLVGNGGANPVPIVLTTSSGMNADAAHQVQALDIAHGVLIGGDAVLPQAVESGLERLGASYSRLGGSDRFDTARKVGEFALAAGIASATNPTPGLGFGTHAPLLANGGVPLATAWADALTAGPYAARTNKIVVLTGATSLPEDTKALLSNNKAKLEPVIAVGLGGAVSTEVVNEANKLVAD